MTLATLTFSGVAGAQPDGAVVVDGSAAVVVDGSDRATRAGTSALGCAAAAGSTGAVDVRIEAPADGGALTSTVTRLLCVLGTLPAEIARPALPRIGPWFSLMHF